MEDNQDADRKEAREAEDHAAVVVGYAGVVVLEDLEDLEEQREGRLVFGFDVE